jgi:hypothetical protein
MRSGQSLHDIIPERLRERQWAGYRHVIVTARFGGLRKLKQKVAQFSHSIECSLMLAASA